MRIKITADSTCDLSEELLAQWDIALMPMHILMGEDSYLDGRCVCLCECGRQNAQIRRRKSGGIYRIF